MEIFVPSSDMANETSPICQQHKMWFAFSLYFFSCFMSLKSLPVQEVKVMGKEDYTTSIICHQYPLLLI